MARGSARAAAAGEELSERLLDAAAQVLAEHGLGELTVRRVAERAESSTMGVYSRFGGRSGILEALYRRLFAQLARELRAVPATADPVQDIRSLTEAYRAFAVAGPQRYAFMFADPLPAFVPGPELRAETVQTTFAPLLDAVRRAGAGGKPGDSVTETETADTETADRDANTDTDTDTDTTVTQAAYCLWCIMHGLIGLEFTDVLRTPMVAWGITGEDGAAAERMFHAGVGSMIAGLDL